MKLLLLSHDLELAKTWALSQVPDLFIVDERELALLNPVKFSLKFDDINYSREMVEFTKMKVSAFNGSRAMAVLMDMRHQMAVDQIPHDISLLLYDGSLDQRIAYNPIYKTTHKVSNFNDLLLQNLLQKTI